MKDPRVHKSEQGHGGYVAWKKSLSIGSAARKVLCTCRPRFDKASESWGTAGSASGASWNATRNRLNLSDLADLSDLSTWRLNSHPFAVPSLHVRVYTLSPASWNISKSPAFFLTFSSADLAYGLVGKCSTHLQLDSLPCRFWDSFTSDDSLSICLALSIVWHYLSLDSLETESFRSFQSSLIVSQIRPQVISLQKKEKGHLADFPQAKAQDSSVDREISVLLNTYFMFSNPVRDSNCCSALPFLSCTCSHNVQEMAMTS